MKGRLSAIMADERRAPQPKPAAWRAAIAGPRQTAVTLAPFVRADHTALMKVSMLNSDRSRFLLAWVRRPLRIASVTPSSTFLAALITREITPSSAPVLELGPGTGVFTQALLARGVAPGEITLVEREEAFIILLRQRFPLASVLAIDVRQIAREKALQDCCFGAVVSGLPLPNLSRSELYALIAACFDRLAQGGAFYQFTYGLKCPVPSGILRALGLRSDRIGWTLRNFPPAAVYRISRRGCRVAADDAAIP